LQGAALKKSGIKSFRDLKGKRVPLSAPGSPSKYVTLAAMEAYGVLEKDFKPSYLTYNEMVQALKDGTVDASMVFAGVPASAMLDISSTFDIQLLPVEDQMTDKIIKKHPYFSKAVIPAKMYGQSEAVPTIATPAILITFSDQPAKVVYDMVKVITEHTAELAAIHKAGAYWNLDDATAGIAIPFHEGATKFLKEKGKLK
jgi:TRAP transporter TAXI family solute receptor